MLPPRAIFLMLFMASPWASADIYKCADANGQDKYQNFPCAIDSIGSTATATPQKEQTAAPETQLAVASVHSVQKQPEPGMKMSEVRAELGPPSSTKVIKSVEIWYYEGIGHTTRAIRFNRTGTVVSVTEGEQAPETD